MKGELKNLSLDYETRKPEITLTVDGNIEQLEKLKGQTLAVELKRYRRRRSLEANAFYWSIVSQIAVAGETSNAYIHNKLLRKYGQLEIINGQAIYVVLPDTEAVESQINESETYHLKPTTEVRSGKGDLTYRTYMMIRGSSSYDSAEMSRLIDGAIWMAKEDAGITIDITETEKREMLERYGQKFTKNRTE